MDIQRLRNLTTGILHTEICHVYEDIEFLTGQKGIMTHMIPRACRSLIPFLKSRLEERFFDEKFDLNHVGKVEIDPLSSEELNVFFEKYQAMPNPLDGKNVVAVIV